MPKPDVIFEAYGEDVRYQLRCNPDSPLGQGYKWGAELRHQDTSVKDAPWSTPVFIAPDALEALGLAFLEASKDLT